jgi:hypothetical protein
MSGKVGPTVSKHVLGAVLALAPEVAAGAVNDCGVSPTNR